MFSDEGVKKNDKCSGSITVKIVDNDLPDKVATCRRNDSQLMRIVRKNVMVHIEPEKSDACSKVESREHDDSNCSTANTNDRFARSTGEKSNDEIDFPKQNHDNASSLYKLRKFYEGKRPEEPISKKYFTDELPKGNVEILKQQFLMISTQYSHSVSSINSMTSATSSLSQSSDDSALIESKRNPKFKQTHQISEHLAPVNDLEKRLSRSLKLKASKRDAFNKKSYLDGKTQFNLYDGIQSQNSITFSDGADLKEKNRRSNARKLKNCIRELIETERTYIEGLKHVIDDYVPLLDEENCPLPKSEKDTIFANIEGIYEFHSQKLYPEMKKCRRDLKKLTECFISYEEVFDMYIVYTYKNKLGNKIICKNKKFFNERKKQLGRSLDLSSFLLYPIQRLPRYILILGELLKTYRNVIGNSEDESTNESLYWTSDDENSKITTNDESTILALENAVGILKRVLNAADNSLILTNIVDCPLTLNAKDLLLNDRFNGTEVSAKKTWFMQCFLFQNMMLLTKVEKRSDMYEIYHYHDIILTSQLGLSPTADSRTFSVWCEKLTHKNYILQSTLKVNKEWVDAISKILWQEAIKKKEKIQSMHKETRQTFLKPVKRSSMNKTYPRSQTKDKKYKSCPGIDHKLNEKVSKKKKRTTWYIDDCDIPCDEQDT